MLRLTRRDSINITAIGSVDMEMHVRMRGYEDGHVELTCWHLAWEDPECTVQVGDKVHINVSQFGTGLAERFKTEHDFDAIWSEIRQFEVVSMKAKMEKVHVINDKYMDQPRCEVILKEIDRQSPHNDGQYWVFYDGPKSKYVGVTGVGLSKIGRELTDETIAEAKERGLVDNYGDPSNRVNLTMAPSSYVQYCWEYYIEHNFYNKNYGKGMAKTVYAFPDADKPVESENEKENKVTTGVVLFALLWGFVPEGGLGVSYLVLTLFGCAIVSVTDLGGILIILFVILYWIKNAELKTNGRNKIGK